MRNKEHMPKEGRRIKEERTSARRKGTFVVVFGWSLLLIIILETSKKIFHHLLYSYSLQSNREESRRNKEPFGMQKEGRRIKEDNQQGGRKVRSTVVALGWSLLLIIILVQRLSKKYSITFCIYILCRDIVTGKNQVVLTGTTQEDRAGI